MDNKFSEGLKERLSKNDGSTKDQLKEMFNDSSMKLIYDFIKNVESGTIQIDNTADLMRLFQIYKDVNDINEGEGTGTMPTLPRSQSHVFDSYVESETNVTEDGEEDIINSDDLMNMTTEDVAEMMKEREIEVNQDNEQAF